MNPPQLSDIQSADLTDFDRLAELFRQCVGLKIFHGSEADWITFFSMACNALRVARRPGAFLASNLYHRRFTYSSIDEQNALVYLRTRKIPKMAKTSSRNPRR